MKAPRPHHDASAEDLRARVSRLEARIRTSVVMDWETFREYCDYCHGATNEDGTLSGEAECRENRRGPFPACERETCPAMGKCTGSK
mgnify:CR=1 FL=1|jgi:hypothetical protein